MALHFLALTYGTEGDTRPLASLCRALIDSGHQARLLADVSTLAYPRALGVPVAPLAGDIRTVMTRNEGMRDISRALADVVRAQSTPWLQQAVAAGQGCDAVIVSGLTAFVGLSAAEALDVPAIGAMMIPITPTAAFPAPFLPPGLPRMFNRASHLLVDHGLWWSVRKTTNLARAAVGLPPRRAAWTEHPMLYGISPALVPRPDDWPDNAWNCGQWQAALPQWTAPSSLMDFLAAGEPPAYVGFGSMAGFDKRRVVTAVIEALGARRVLFGGGWSDIDASSLPANFHPIGDTPHDWLFPRTSLVVHHGGAGTTHSACRAGVPSVIVPFAGDQPFWAARLRDAGMADAVLAGKSVSAEALRQAIAFAETAPAREAAARIGARIRAEDGCATAVGLIEKLTRHGLSRSG